MSIILKSLKSFLKIFIPDSFYIRYEYYKFTGRFFSDKRIETFSDRVFSWKINESLYDYSIFVDKYKVRDFVTLNVGQAYLPKLIKVFRDPDDFELSELPERFVIKLNNGCGFNLVVTDKRKHSNAEIQKLIAAWLKSDFYSISKEKQYKNVEQVVICEEYIESEGDLKDYKFYCIDGSIEFVQVIGDRLNGETKHNYYSKEWKPLSISREEYAVGELEDMPSKFEEAVKVVELLCKSFSFVRVDLYIQDKIYFGELTFTPGNGYIKFLPSSYDRDLAKRMKLEIKF